MKYETLMTYNFFSKSQTGRSGGDRMVCEFITIHAHRAYRH
jgi:hypothetical protein